MPNRELEPGIGAGNWSRELEPGMPNREFEPGMPNRELEPGISGEPPKGGRDKGGGMSPPHRVTPRVTPSDPAVLALESRSRRPFGGNPGNANDPELQISGKHSKDSGFSPAKNSSEIQDFLKIRRILPVFLQNKESAEPESKIPREDEEEEPVKHREIKLRNYDPEDEELKKRKLPPAKPASVEETVKEQLEAAKPEPIIDEVDLANLAPRKPDWDLKRDVSKKLEKLEKRTQRAIAELIRERLKGQEEELASAVGSAKQDGSDSD
ncbi:coiled-coil domain-containing protein 12 [Cyanistes caeruleus]|uniref:coiled-coil domain-containing protein 12 n=1 Tax=Cyanistes caeruleus TaxID=156563 RepID=UPI000CDB9DFE|nr:coiled-coil domain-containing protein 12 [Cyanistes caeruleus]